MELFLVITILSVITLITFPLLRRPLNESVVQDAGQQLLRDLSAARSQAIESGRPVLFQYQTGSGRYYIGEQDQRLENFSGTRSDKSTDSESTQLPPRDQFGSSKSNDPSSPNRSAAPKLSLHRELPAEVTFDSSNFLDREASDSAFSNRPPGTETGRDRQKRVDAINGENLSAKERAPKENTRESSDSVRPEALQWSAPIRFYPSGRIRPAKVPLLSPDGVKTDLEILGLAGRIRLAPLRKPASDE